MRIESEGDTDSYTSPANISCISQQLHRKYMKENITSKKSQLLKILQRLLEGNAAMAPLWPPFNLQSVSYISLFSLH